MPAPNLCIKVLRLPSQVFHRAASYKWRGEERENKSTDQFIQGVLLDGDLWETWRVYWVDKTYTIHKQSFQINVLRLEQCNIDVVFLCAVCTNSVRVRLHMRTRSSMGSNHMILCTNSIDVPLTTSSVHPTNYGFAVSRGSSEMSCERVSLWRPAWRCPVKVLIGVEAAASCP